MRLLSRPPLSRVVPREELPGPRPRVVVLYHYFYPDDVVSAHHYAGLCLDLAGRGWEVEAMPCNRSCREESLAYPLHEEWRGITIRRVWRPRFRQASTLGRLLNTFWMLTAWCLRLVLDRRQGPDVLVIGTDPVLSVLVALVVRKLRPGIRIAHWCFDLYPEGPIADGMLRPDGLPARMLRRLLRWAYASCDLVADLGACMRERLEPYQHPGRKVTLVPWALAEPAEVEEPDPATRWDLFGSNPLGLLYSGNFGRAHSCTEFLELARRLRHDGVHFCFGARGNRADELRASVRPDDRNVSLAGFVPESELVKRLAAADIHLVSLRPEWTGLVVPSKFFGALAAGRPVIFAGSRDAVIARWIEEHKVGWVLDEKSQDDVAEELRRFVLSRDKLEVLKGHCHHIYKTHFSRGKVMDKWHSELKKMLASSATASVILPAGLAEGPLEAYQVPRA